MKKPTITVPTNKHLVRLAEMEQTVAEQDNSLSSLTHKLKVVIAELDQQRQLAAAQAMEHAAETARWEIKTRRETRYQDIYSSHHFSCFFHSKTGGETRCPNEGSVPGGRRAESSARSDGERAALPPYGARGPERGQCQVTIKHHEEPCGAVEDTAGTQGETAEGTTQCTTRVNV